MYLYKRKGGYESWFHSFRPLRFSFALANMMSAKTANMKAMVIDQSLPLYKMIAPTAIMRSAIPLAMKIIPFPATVWIGASC